MAAPFTTADLIAGLPPLSGYRVRITSDSPGYRLVDFGRRLFSAGNEAARINAIGGGLIAIVEKYATATGATLRTFG